MTKAIKASGIMGRVRESVRARTTGYMAEKSVPMSKHVGSGDSYHDSALPCRPCLRARSYSESRHDLALLSHATYRSPSLLWRCTRCSRHNGLTSCAPCACGWNAKSAECALNEGNGQQVVEHCA